MRQSWTAASPTPPSASRFSYTVNQVENIYWALVSSYEDVQAKQHALEQSSKLLDDNKKQLEIGTLAPLDVVNAESTVASDQQALISSQEQSELSATGSQAGHRPQPERSGAGGGGGDSHRPREPGADSRGEAAGGGAGAIGLPESPGAGTGRAGHQEG
jgi:hypothetical protein